MSSIWMNNATGEGGISPFATSGMAPEAGGGAATKYRSMANSSQQPQIPTGMSARPMPGGKSGSSGTLAASPSVSPSVSPSGSSASGSAAAITANDFLTLLVTEMQNQDPTSQTDPNEYINQLVQINSLEQLISINQDLSTVSGASQPPTTSTTLKISPTSTVHQSHPSDPSEGYASKLSFNSKSNGTVVSPSEFGSSGNAAGQTAVQTSAKSTDSLPGSANPSGGHSLSSRVKVVAPGNLAIPGESEAAHAIGQSLNGQSHLKSQPYGHGVRDIPIRALANR